MAGWRPDDDGGGEEGPPRRAMCSRCTQLAGRARGPRGVFPLAVALLALLLAAACGASVQPSPAASPAAPTAASTPPGPAAPLRSLRDFDFSSPDFVAGLLTRAGGGEVHRERVQFEDLTADGREEAVVVVESGGTAGDIGVAVYGLLEGAPQLLFFQRLAGHVEVRLGLVVIQEGVYAEGEAECCPSQLRELAYGWMGGKFTLISEQVVENPRQ